LRVPMKKECPWLNVVTCSNNYRRDLDW
jgi:hypothetical protein